MVSNRFERRLFIGLPITAIGLAITLQYSGIDLALERLFYDFDTGVWPLKEPWVMRRLFHTYVQHLLKFVGLIAIGYILYLWIRNQRAPLRKILSCTLLSMALGMGIIGFLKGQMRVYSPWDLELFGGVMPHVSLFQSLTLELPPGRAFPSAHAACGFAFVSVYFSCALFARRWRFHALISGLGLGFVFGFIQQLRGAHFLSHDLFSLAICWLGALTVHFIFFPKLMRELMVSQSPSVSLKQPSFSEPTAVAPVQFEKSTSKKLKRLGRD